MNATKKHIGLDAARTSGMRHADAVAIVSHVLQAIVERLLAGDSVELRGLGRFRPYLWPGRKPGGCVSKQALPYWTVRFKPSSVLRRTATPTPKDSRAPMSVTEPFHTPGSF